MLRLDPLELLQLFLRPGGLDFTLFLNDLVRTVCKELGIPDADVSTCSRTDANDGGVDTRVRSGAAGDKTGYFRTPTIWQFKAADQARVTVASLTKEVNKPHAKKCIEEGHAYRLCVCANFADAKRTSLEMALQKAVHKINPSSPEPRILTVDDIKEIADRYPALVLRLRGDIDSQFLLFDRWAANVKDVTRVFIPNSTFRNMQASVLGFVDLPNTPPDAVLPICGLSGVGKTRTVYECLATLPQASSLVLYIDDEDQADELARMLVNEASARSILVIDDCSLSVRQQVARTLRASRDRIRCICIGDTETPGSAAPELNVPKLNSVELEKILRQNFPGVPFDRLWAYATLADGFVRLAADMCQRDGQIKTAGNVSPVIQSVADYYRERLTPEQRRSVEAISFLKRVKRKGEPAQLDSLCEWLHENRKTIEENLAAVKDAPGFVEKGALYYRVTPEIIAMVAFEQAWTRWADGNENALLSKIPEDVQEDSWNAFPRAPARRCGTLYDCFFPDSPILSLRSNFLIQDLYAGSSS
jgi:hypothetical protein